MFVEQHGRAPADDRELSGFLARSSRPAASTVAGYDLTFSPVKSVSALWAIAPREVSELIAETHHDAVADTISWLEKQRLLHPPRQRRARAGRDHRVPRGRVHPPRLARRRPGSAHPCRGLEQGLRPGRHLAGPGRAGAVQEQGRRVRAVQHPPGGPAHRAARRPVRRPRTLGRQAAGPRDRRPRPRAAAFLVVAAGGHRARVGRAPDPVPGRARTPADLGRGPRPGPAGHARDPGGQARPARTGRATRHLARGRRHRARRRSRPSTASCRTR